ncbi:hypothetical protein DFJ74DRAFT_681750 [Hyaloraphidium curvatum]|nr:hypothetical protein DFJ74DRAFT_681750 [Hyaloraphidium curvatum]
MSERRESLRLFANSAPTTPSKRGSAENEDNTQDSILDGKRRRRSTMGTTTAKSILKSPGGAKSPSRAALSDAEAVLNSGEGPGSAKKEKGVTFEPKSAEKRPAADRKSKAFRKSLGRRVSFAQTAHIRLFEKDDDWLKSPDANKTQDVGADFNFSGSSAGFQIPDLSSVRRTSDAFDLRLSLPGHVGPDTSISSDTSQRSFEIAVKGGSPEHAKGHLAGDDDGVRHVLDLSFSTIAPGSGLNSSVPPSPIQPQLDSAMSSPRRSPRRLSVVSSSSRRRSSLAQVDNQEDMTSHSINSGLEYGDNLSEMSMELVECDGGIESTRRMSSASANHEAADGPVLEELDQKPQEPSSDGDAGEALVDATMQSALMDETNCIGGISVVVEEEYEFERPRTDGSFLAPDGEAESVHEDKEDGNPIEDRSRRTTMTRQSLFGGELPMDVTRCIGGIMRSEVGSELDEDGELLLVDLALLLHRPQPFCRGTRPHFPLDSTILRTAPIFCSS